MSGTDFSQQPILEAGPVIVLVRPQLGENIGAAARAMLNCGLTVLRLVQPQDTWPNPRAKANAAGADIVLDQAQLFDDTAAAVADLQRVFAATARDRSMVQLQVTPKYAAIDLHAAIRRGETCGILFGPERSGLVNDDLILADTLIRIPLNPAFASLNLGQAVLVVGYEWFQSGNLTPERRLTNSGANLADKASLGTFFAHLEQELDAAAFFPVEGKRRSMVRAIWNLFQRAVPTEQEVRTLHGIVTALSGRRLGGKPRYQ
jgi:tRNA/rRNA methyltransferase